MKKSNTEDFVKSAKSIHGNKYDYSKVEYINSYTKVCIICPKHGEFWQTPKDHIHSKAGCPMCYGNKKYTLEEFILKAREVHGWKYDYSKVKYENYETKICIICPEHGEFWQTPHSHLSGNGCPFCAGKALGQSLFIKKSIEKHGNKYDYSKVEYKGNKEKVCIICPEHGEFWQTPSQHLRHGCFKCGNALKGESLKSTKENFIEKAKLVHGDKYDYSKVEYKNNRTPVCIICPKHGEFLQKPNYHLSGNGCQKCNKSHMERELSMFFQENDIVFEEQKQFDWLGKQSLDFYLPEYNIAIECQGTQHFIKMKSITDEKVEKIKKLDAIKYEKSTENGIKLLYYVDSITLNFIKKHPKQYNVIYKEENTFFDKNNILKQIKS